MKFFLSRFFTLLSVLLLNANLAQATVILYEQGFENPSGFANNEGDVDINSPVNNLHGNQPPGFTFSQSQTVETLLITGDQAFGTGYSDPTGTGGSYALGMLEWGDLLAMPFNVGGHDYLNFRLDISSINLSVFGGPFNIGVPVFEFSLYDNPGGAPGLGGGTLLDAQQATGTASANDLFDWTEVTLPLNTVGNTDGNVILRIDLHSGGYAATDNFLVAASDSPGDIAPARVPEPTSLTLLGLGLASMAMARRRNAFVKGKS